MDATRSRDAAILRLAIGLAQGVALFLKFAEAQKDAQRG